MNTENSKLCNDVKIHLKYTQIEYVVLSTVHWYRDRLKLQLDFLDFFLRFIILNVMTWGQS